MLLLFPAVLRDHKRLASKLTSDELRAIRDYIEERLRQEQADVNFRLYALRNDYDVTVRRSSETISDLHQELSEKKEIIKHYQDTDQNITFIIRQKEDRWAKKQDLLLNEIGKLEGEAVKAKTQLESVQDELNEQSKTVKHLEEKLAVANTCVDKVKEAKEALKERDECRNEVLRLKMDIDQRNRQILGLERTVEDLRKSKEDVDKGDQFSELKVKAMQEKLRKQVNNDKTFEI